MKIGQEDFERCVNILIDVEGGYVDDPDDPGGETNMGISKRSYPDLDIKNLSREQVEDIYFVDYWMLTKCSRIPRYIRYQVFDFAVHSGVDRAVKTLQEVLGTKQDGIIGPITIEKSFEYFLNCPGGNTGPYELGAYMAARAQFLMGLYNFPKFGKGWLARLFYIASVNLTN